MSEEQLTQAQKDALFAAFATGVDGLSPEQEKMFVAYFTDAGKNAADAAADLANAALSGVENFLNDIFDGD